MKIVLTKSESEKIFFDCLCNICSYWNGYGLVIDYDASAYKLAREKITPENRTFESVVMQILKDGGKLMVIDEENNGEYNREISLKDIHRLVSKTPVDNLLNIQTGNDDVNDADAVLQTVFFGEIIFG